MCLFALTIIFYLAWKTGYLEQGIEESTGCYSSIYISVSGWKDNSWLKVWR
jgi:hypothetical protein